jgi:hypothetical protein
LRNLTHTWVCRSYDDQTVVAQSQLVIDTRNATKAINSAKIVRF